MSEIKPCPFCGSSVRPKVKDFSGEPYVPGYEVVCDAAGWDGDPSMGCGASTGWAESGLDAIAAWNRRAPDNDAFNAGVRAASEKAEAFYRVRRAILTLIKTGEGE